MAQADQGYGAERAAARFRAELARLRLEATSRAVLGALEDKAGFDPNQPRVPAGRRTGGQWVALLGDRARSAARMVRDAAARVDAEVSAFLILNQEAVIRILGGVQAASGAGESVAGVVTAASGGATTPLGGAGLAALGSWMVVNGFDNFEAGWRTLLTGQSHDTNLNETLRSWGMTADEADATELLLSGGVGLGAARATRTAFARQVEAGLARRALAAFSDDALDVRVGGRSLWEERDIQRMGEAWEAFDAERTGYALTSRFYPGFDQISPDGRVAISNKTMNLNSPSYHRTSHAVFDRLKHYVEQAAGFPPERVRESIAFRPAERRIHLLLPAGQPVRAHALQLTAAEVYARSRGIILQIEYSR